MWFRGIPSGARPGLLLLGFTTIAHNVAPAAGTGPLAVQPAKQWAGNEGNWSTWNVHVGTPPQTARVFVGIATQNTWVVMPDGCNDTHAPSTCETDRGGFVTWNKSSSWVPASKFWQNKGFYKLVNLVGQALGYYPSGEYGFDTLDMDWTSNTGHPVKNTILAGMVDTDYYVGELGVSPRVTNFTKDNSDSVGQFKDPRPSYLHLLKSNKLISSWSYGLQVGSYHRRDQVGDRAFGSLVFGGYDLSWFVPNGVKFPMYPDVGNEFKVAVRDIVLDNGDSLIVDASSGKPTRITAMLDTTQSYIWLPESICKNFETQFGLTWDQEFNRYLLDDDSRDQILASKTNFTFKLGPNANTPSSTTEELSISIPIAALVKDAEITWPVSSEQFVQSIAYFPIRRAANDSQYVLGRAFMQEVYLISDYEQSTFTVSAVAWNSTAPAQLAEVKATQPADDKSPGLSKGALAGIIIGAIIVFVLLVAVALFFVRKWHQRRREKARREPYVYEPSGGRHEVEAEMNQIYELPGETYEHEADWSAERVELGGKEVIAEVFGSPVVQVDSIDPPEDKDEHEEHAHREEPRSRPRSRRHSVEEPATPDDAQPQPVGLFRTPSYGPPEESTAPEPETPQTARRTSGVGISPMSAAPPRTFEHPMITSLRRQPTIISPLAESPQQTFDEAIRRMQRRPTETTISPIDEVPRGRAARR